MLRDQKLRFGKGEKEAYIGPKMANRRGLLNGSECKTNPHSALPNGDLFCIFPRFVI